MKANMRTLLLTGATGFVGRAVYPALVAAGWSVRGLTRDAARARARFPAVAWVEGDVSDAAACARALEGCSAALYLVHGIGAGADYHAQEVHAAETFARAANAAQVGRLAREVVIGLTEDLLAADDRFWSLIDHPHRLSFAGAAARALAAKGSAAAVPGIWGTVERARRRP